MAFVKGKSGNPTGRPKRTQQEFDLIAACREKAPEALAVIEHIMMNGESERVRLTAALAVLDRAFGPPVAATPESSDKAQALRDLADALPD